MEPPSAIRRLDGSWNKLRWAEEHFKTFEAATKTFDLKDVSTMRTHYYPQTQHFLTTIHEIAACPVEWGLMVGDVLHNARGGLDHLAWYLVKIGECARPKEPERVQFPIYDREGRFFRALPKRLPGVPMRHWTLIEARQPYRRRPVAKQLVALSNDDKHRLVHVVALGASKTDITVDHRLVRDFRITAETFMPGIWPPFKPGAKLLRICGVQEGPNPYVDVKAESAYSIAFDDGSWVGTTLRQILDYATELLAHFETVLTGGPLQSELVESS